eukprot:2873582-Pyramimonas_sp.AAC.1
MCLDVTTTGQPRATTRQLQDNRDIHGATTGQAGDNQRPTMGDLETTTRQPRGNHWTTTGQPRHNYETTRGHR